MIYPSNRRGTKLQWFCHGALDFILQLMQMNKQSIESIQIFTHSSSYLSLTRDIAELVIL
jgi:hypothetical protein